MSRLSFRSVLLPAPPENAVCVGRVSDFQLNRSRLIVVPKDDNRKELVKLFQKLAVSKGRAFGQGFGGEVHQYIR